MRQGVDLPRARLGRVSPPAPEVDDVLAVVPDGDRRSRAGQPSKDLSERFTYRFEAGADVAVDVHGDHRGMTGRMRSMSEDLADADRRDDEDAAERVTWLELFFDLVVVAGLGALTAGLQAEVSDGGVALFIVLYVAIWMTWISVVLYANIARAQTHVGTVIAVMALIALMAASSPGVFEDRANVFAIAFLVARGIVARRALQTGRLLSGWPLLQFGGLTTIWIVAMFVDAPLKFWLWGAALAHRCHFRRVERR